LRLETRERVCGGGHLFTIGIAEAFLIHSPLCWALALASNNRRRPPSPLGFRGQRHPTSDRGNSPAVSTMAVSAPATRAVLFSNVDCEYPPHHHQSLSAHVDCFREGKRGSGKWSPKPRDRVIDKHSVRISINGTRPSHHQMLWHRVILELQYRTQYIESESRPRPLLKMSAVVPLLKRSRRPPPQPRCYLAWEVAPPN